MKSFLPLLLVAGLAGCTCPRPTANDVAPGSPPAPVAASPQTPVHPLHPVPVPGGTVLSKEMSLFDGKSLSGWKITEFGGHGDVHVENGVLKIPMGADLSGITWTNGGLPNVDYEIELEAMKEDGSDFFCGLTFPVKDSFCSLILGGWGGGVVGLSSLDGMDASENDTSKNIYFERQRWYRLRLRVLEDKIQAWLDDQKIIDVETAGRKVALRPGAIDLCAPLGIATWQTDGAYRKMVLRPVP